MGYHGNGDLNRVYKETAGRHGFYTPGSLGGTPANLFGSDAVENHQSIFRSDQFQLQQKLEMYSMPMPSIFNFHLKVDENQQHQFQLQQAPVNNGMFLKKEVVVNSQGQLMPPMAHSSQSLSVVTQPPLVVPTALPLPPQSNQANFILEHHIKIDKSSTKPYTCNYCAKAYKQLMGIKNHVKTHIMTNNEAILNCSVCGKASACPNPVRKPFVCNNCQDVKHQIQQQQHHNNQQQQQQQLVQQHQQHIVQQTQNTAGTSSVNSSYHQVKPNPPEEEEDSCPESEKQYQCQFCHKRFQHPSTLKMHLKKHTDDKPFVCTYCNKNFKRNSSLKIHERTHTGEKTHECSYCGKLFAYEVFLKVHVRKHTGEKPYTCSVCDKTFTQAGNLKSHMKRKHMGADDILNILT